MSILTNLTEGIVNRDLSKEGEAILNKWDKTGLLEGISGDFHRNQMAVLLENQAKELLRESTTMQGGDVEGFAAVAFPIVRRVFGGLLAQKLVSVQPMSLPSGLVFFMDFLKENPEFDASGAASTAARDGLEDGKEPSVYGGQIAGRQLETSGVELNPEARAFDEQTPQFYDLVHGHSSARQQSSITLAAATSDVVEIALDGDVGDSDARILDFDADLLATEASESLVAIVVNVQTSVISAAQTTWAQVASPDLRHIAVLADANNLIADAKLVRRLTKLETKDVGSGSAETLKLVFVGATGAIGATESMIIDFAVSDNIGASSAGGAGSVIGATAWEMEGSAALPEIKISVESTAITAQTRKLKASWTPELAQDLNAYHNLDAEVELTGILSEQIALEIDQEILSDLIAGAQGSKLYWSRRPGLFVNRLTGADATSLASPPDFTGSVSEWYETLVETINDVSADIHRKTLRGGANFLVCGPEVANILEFTSGFRASVTHDDATGSVGAVQIGSINKKWDLHVDPYFPRNVILVGRKGGSFLESGYVYAPYVPLQVTPTIFDTEDFTPRKAVMTRYGKKMVRPDMYGLVVVRDLEG